MKYLLWLLLLFAAAVALTTAAQNSAYVLLVYPPYRIELSLTLFVVLLLLAFVLGHVLLRLIHATTQLPAYVRKFRLERARVKARKLLDDALHAYFEGNYAAAEKASVRAMELGDTSALHPIIAARSAHELQEFEKRDAYLSASEGKTVGDATMRLMATTKFMLDQRDPHAALYALRELRASGIKGHPGALTLELKAQQQAGNWDEALAVLNQLEKRKSIDVTVASQLRQQAWLEKIRQQKNLDDLTACLKTIPGEFKRRGKIAAAAVRALAQHGGCSLAQQLLSDSLNAQWDSDLVALYGDCQSADDQPSGMNPQIEQAEKWLNHHRNDAGLLLSLGKLCLRQKLWGKAQNYLEASVSIAPRRAAFTALGQLAEQLGKADAAFKYYQQAMALTKARDE